MKSDHSRQSLKSVKSSGYGKVTNTQNVNRNFTPSGG